MAGAVGSSPARAETDLEMGMKSKQQVDEMKKEVSEIRAETAKKITFKRQRTLEDLVKNTTLTREKLKR